MKKRLISTLFIACLCATMIGCGSASSDANAGVDGSANIETAGAATGNTEKTDDSKVEKNLPLMDQLGTKYSTALEWNATFYFSGWNRDD